MLSGDRRFLLEQEKNRGTSPGPSLGPFVCFGTPKQISFGLVKKHPIDQELNAMSQFWIAECNYKLANYFEAIKCYDKFRFTNGALLTEQFIDLDYHLAYAYFDKSSPYAKLKASKLKSQKRDLNESIKYFRNYIHQTNISDSAKFRTALLRIADGYFILKDDSLAIENYQRSIEINNTDHSYALYQMATSQGLVQDYEGKMKTLQSLTTMKTLHWRPNVQTPLLQRPRQA